MATRPYLIAALSLLCLLPSSGRAHAQGHEQASALSEKCDVAGLRAFVGKQPAVVNSRNENGMPLLIRAAMTGCLGAVELLVGQGADVQVTDKMLRTPLHAAAGWGTLEMVQFLLGKGAKLNAKTARGLTPLSFAQENFYQDKDTERKRITAYLIKNGAK